MNASKFRALANYEVSDPYPLTLNPGDEVSVKQHDASWQGWVWVEIAGQAGWVPESYLDSPDQATTHVIHAFDGHELSAAKNEILTGLKEISGWVWCRKENGETGWFPLFNLKPAPEAYSESS